jgi:Holliday junction DNA helicase RuvA
VVRDDAIHLYGFKDLREKDTFESLISVSGVGPRLAVSILSGISPDDLWVAVTGRDTARLTKVPGVGKKTAARLVVELEGKLPQAEADAPAASARSQASADVISALVNLGYPEAAASKAVDKAVAALGPEAELEELLRETLKSLR